MDAFEAYGETATARCHSRARRQPDAKPASPVEEALERRNRERRTLAAIARRQDRAATKAAMDCPEGRRLAAMLRWMRSLSADQASEFLEVMAGEDWLLDAPVEFRRVAQRLFGRVIDRIRRRAGLDPLDDPLPWDTAGHPVGSVHNRIKHLLDLR